MRLIVLALACVVVGECLIVGDIVQALRPHGSVRLHRAVVQIVSTVSLDRLITAVAPSLTSEAFYRQRGEAKTIGELLAAKQAGKGLQAVQEPPGEPIGTAPVWQDAQRCALLWGQPRALVMCSAE